MAAKGSLTIRILGENQDFVRKLDNTKSKLDEVGGKLRSIGTRMSAFVTAPIVGAGVAAFNMASDLNEAMSAVDQIFGDSAGEVQGWSKTTADSLGIARSEALTAAAGFGNFLQTTGLAQGEAAGMSQEIIGLAADMASFNNQDPSEMLDKLRSGLAGEAEPLRRFGVLISAARVESKALELGLADANGEVDEGAKVQARFALIMEDTIRQQGDFQRTADGAANKQRILAARFRTMSETLGQQLLPIGIRVLDFFGGLIERFENLSPKTQRIIFIVAGLAAALGPLLLVAGLVASAISALIPVFAVLAGPVGLIIAAIVGLGAAFVWAYNNSETFREIVQAVFERIQTVVEYALNFVRAVIEGFVERVTAVWDEWGDEIMTFATIVWDTVSGVVDGALKVITGIWDTFAGVFTGDWERVWNGVKSFFAGIWETTTSILSGAWETIKLTVLTALNTLKGSVEDKLNDLVGFFRSLPDRILNAVGNVGSLLFNAGQNVVQGFIDGVTGMFGKVRDKFNQLTSFLPDWKGPESVDRRILYGAGRTVMEGFERGVSDGFGSVQSTLGDFTGGLAGVSAAGGGGSLTIVVQGSVVSEGELVETVRRGLAQVSRRNGGTGIV